MLPTAYFEGTYLEIIPKDIARMVLEKLPLNQAKVFAALPGKMSLDMTRLSCQEIFSWILQTPLTNGEFSILHHNVSLIKTQWNKPKLDENLESFQNNILRFKEDGEILHLYHSKDVAQMPLGSKVIWISVDFEAENPFSLIFKPYPILQIKQTITLLNHMAANAKKLTDTQIKPQIIESLAKSNTLEETSWFESELTDPKLWFDEVFLSNDYTIQDMI